MTDPNVDERLSPNHHLTLKGSTWWVSVTAYKAGRRLRFSRSLKTSDVRVARKRRDELVAAIASEPGARVIMRERRRNS